ncbi:MAG: hydrogenase maturation nickel metallochaperone HypA [Candidatus Lokiarchaeota archaeon]|nr:hydrogenase maturation nickel metallochaperone HypA [Candidatus Lokiarchaeota archaeon]
MHEFSFAYNIFKVAEATAVKNNAKKITEVHLEIGQLTLIVPELLKRSFEMATSGSMAEGAELVIDMTPGKIKCRDCGKESSVTLDEESHLTGLQLFQCKHCQSKDTEIIDGKKANIKNIKIL